MRFEILKAISGISLSDYINLKNIHCFYNSKLKTNSHKKEIKCLALSSVQ
ncbi:MULTISPECIES: hypothetical protein [unclassified Campylobacter]|nr:MULTISPECIES: hypothetical protein [unclassified Campylobacter]